MTTSSEATTTSTAPAATVTAGMKRDQQPPPHQYNAWQLNSAGCGGEGCVAREPWPVHHVRHRGSLCRLCTSCVLRYHPGSFCPMCFELIDAAGGRQPAVVHCVSCPSVCHTACLPDPEKTTSYVCPSCANPNGYLYFSVDCDGDGDVSGSPSKKVRLSDGGCGEENPRMEGQRRGRTIDRESARVLLTAALLASASMNRAVAFARSEAERKAKDAVVARKKAKEMLEKALVAAKREREKRQHVVGPVPAVSEQDRKAAVKPDSAMVSMVAQKRKQNREREQWTKMEDAIPLAQKPLVRAITENERVKAPFPSNHLKHSPGLNPTLHDNVKVDIVGKNGSLPASKSNFTAESKRGAPKMPVESGVTVRSPPMKQGEISQDDGFHMSACLSMVKFLNAFFY